MSENNFVKQESSIEEKELNPMSGWLALIIGILFIISPTLGVGTLIAYDNPIFLVISIILFIVAIFMFCGLKIVNPNESVVFVLFGKYYGTLKKDVYKNYFKGKNVIIEIDSQGARQIREKQKIQSVFLIPPSFEELLHRLKNRGTESKESIHRRLKQALDEIEHIEEYGVLLVNDSVEGTAFVIDALFHPGLKNASGMNERGLKIAKEIRKGIIKYLSDEEGG